MQYRPASFCTIATDSCKDELFGFLLSLAVHHTYEKIYIICDEITHKYILSCSPAPRLDIEWHILLDKYSGMNRAIMEKTGIFKEFLMAKADAIEIALKNSSDVLLLDNDTIILDTLYVLDKNKQLGVSPQYIRKEHVDRTGYYNAGMLWTNDITLPETWKTYTKTSRYFEQACIEDLTKKYTYFEYGKNYNLQTWRFPYGIDSSNDIVRSITSDPEKQMVFYNETPLKFIHTHFTSNHFQNINKFFIQMLIKAKKYQELLIIHRVCYGKWTVTIPSQPRNDIYNHKNDSFRQLIMLCRNRIRDLDITFGNTTQCILSPHVILYDRPTLGWADNVVNNGMLVLLGNGEFSEDKQYFDKKNILCKPWIFWPRQPVVLERMLKELNYKNYTERKNNVVFIGNFENSVQAKYRNNKNSDSWKQIVDDYHCTVGIHHKFNQEDYLERLSEARYGLCIRGYGSKCHREVELMAFGTVPVVTPEVSITSYEDPPVEGVHFFRAKNAQELQYIIETTEEEWNNMSINCKNWYMKNIHSTNCWETMISSILFGKNSL